MLIFCRKTSNLSKALCSPVIYYEFFVMKPPCHRHICSIKRLFCQNYTLNYGPLRSIRCPFFLIFHGKVNAPIPKFCKKTDHVLKNTLLSGAYFVLKRQFAKRYSALISFFFNCDFKTPIFGVKTSILTRLYYIIDKQNQ